MQCRDDTTFPSPFAPQSGYSANAPRFMSTPLARRIVLGRPWWEQRWGFVGYTFDERVLPRVSITAAGEPNEHTTDAYQPATSLVRLGGACGPAMDYAIDAAQRTVLFWDVLRQRGNQYREHMAETVPNVLNYEAELIIDGRTLKRPVNYGLVRIVPPQSIRIEARRRPFVIVDPRAGHGPGIGGFKADSEARAQQPAKLPTIGFLGQSTPVVERQRLDAFLKRLRELGWIDGRTVGVEYAWGKEAASASPRSRSTLFGLRSM
jgi:hypothetical protein